MTHHSVLLSVKVGRPEKIEAKAGLSGIFKRPVNGPVAIGPLGLDGDAVLDRKHHGGPDQAVYIVDFIEKMTNDLGAKNPQLARDIRDWFSKRPEGKPISAGMERLYVELGALDIQAKDGRADLSKIQIESVIIYLSKQKFPPQVVTPITPKKPDRR